MIFKRDDLKIDSMGEFIPFMLIMPFVLLITPFLIAAYTLGLCMKLTGWIDT